MRLPAASSIAESGVDFNLDQTFVPMPDRSRISLSLGVTLMFLGYWVAGPAIAHGEFQEKDHFWSMWQFTPAIALPLLLTLAVYFRGWWKRCRQKKPVSRARTLVFLTGVGCFWVGLQSPIEPLSDHFLFIHQIEHLLLRVFGPLLTILGLPLGPMIQGLPRTSRRYLLVPLIRSRVMQALYGFLSHPIIAPFLFIATLIVWQIPALHDLAVRDPGLHDAMHLSMIVTGFFFWWLIADPRPQARLSYGMRLIVLWLVTIPNTLLGAYITLNKFPLYQVYDVLEGSWHIDRLMDQQLGGILIWGPGAMMGVVGTAVIFLLWLHQEERNHASLESMASDSGSLPTGTR